MPDLEATVVASADPLLHALVDGRYQIDHRIAEGGFGAVYCAIDTVANRVVALKVLHRHHLFDTTIVARFRREADILGRLHDPHTVAMVGSGLAIDGTAYIAMELLCGPSLLELMRAGAAMPWERVVSIARGVCRSLAEAHALGIVHRDLKPTNIHIEPRVDEPDFVKVIDFGIAKPASTGDGDGDLTHVGHMIGTCDYMPPEQMLGGNCTPRSDVFTLGIVIHELITGRRPFGNPGSAAEMLAAVLGTAPAPLVDVPTELARIVARCLACDPAERYADAAELGAALEALQASVRAFSDDDCETKTVVLLRERRMPRLRTIPGYAAFARGSTPELAKPRRTAAGTDAPPSEQPRDSRAWLTLLAIVLGLVALLASS